MKLSKCESDACIEVDVDEGDMLRIRSSLLPHAIIKVTKEEFTAFIFAARAGEYDHYIERIDCPTCTGVAILTPERTYRCAHCATCSAIQENASEQKILQEVLLSDL